MADRRPRGLHPVPPQQKSTGENRIRGRKRFSFSNTYRSEGGNDCSGKGVCSQRHAGAALDVFLAGRGTAHTGTGRGSGGHVSGKDEADRTSDRVWGAL